MADRNDFHLEIVTPYNILFDGPVDMVIIPARDGELGVMHGHELMMAAITSGELRLRIGETWRSVSVSSGYAEIAPDMMIVIVNAAEWYEDINIPRAQKAYDRAKARLENPQTSKQEKIHARHALERASARLKVAEKSGRMTTFKD